MTSTVTNSDKRSTAKTGSDRRSSVSPYGFSRDLLLVTAESTELAPVYLITATGDYLSAGEAPAATNSNKR